jgi:saccharopepsin
LFAFYLTNKNGGMESDITFGYYDTSKFTGKIVWHPIIFEYMFGIKLDDIKIGDKSLGICDKGGLMDGHDCIITVDSGSSEFAMPDLIYDKLPSIGIPTMETSVNCGKFD